MQITLYSFGYKHGPAEADTVLDMRFLPNPYWVPELQNGTGLDIPVAEYVLDNSVAKEFFASFEPLLLAYLDSHRRTGRHSMQVAVGCTGGRHRSVAVAEYLKEILNNRSYDLTVFHRDVDKE